ncbi:hypothetical protein ZIOFF_012013 [Zingiber officinale]|uniref:ER membrane protein complex subunit 2 n=1 Tax=Zingiber officinale TaxID=94328 RepID=A0A8J5HNU2_ZINOF|nr:hypothetical protein ZIOFF_012013 [Zingiber officinale]
MVVAEEAAQLDRLEIQVDSGGGGAWEYLCLVRKLKARRSEKVLKHGLAILNDPTVRSKLGGEAYLSNGRQEIYCFSFDAEWTLYEQVAFAAFDCQQHNVAKDCIAVLSKEFPGSLRVDSVDPLGYLKDPAQQFVKVETSVPNSYIFLQKFSGRLEGMLLEAKGALAEAEKVYARLLEDNPLDQIIFKRMVAIAKARGDMKVAVDFLNKYLDIFMADHDAWRELAEIYVSLQMYKQAAFCYEELILSQPTVSPYHLAYAEAMISSLSCVLIQQVLYTMGSLENLQTAKKYYASAITLSGGKNIRALYGICLCNAAISQLTKGRNKEEKESSDLPYLGAEALRRDYKNRAPKKLPLLNSMLKNMKLSS